MKFLIYFRSFYGSSSNRSKRNTEPKITFVAIPEATISEDDLDNSDDEIDTDFFSDNDDDIIVESETDEELVIEQDTESTSDVSSRNESPYSSSDNEPLAAKIKPNNIQSMTDTDTEYETVTDETVTEGKKQTRNAGKRKMPKQVKTRNKQKQRKTTAKKKFEWKVKTKDDWKVPNDYTKKNQKLKLSPDVPQLTCRSNAIEFFNLFVTTDLLQAIHEQTLLYNQWRHLNLNKRLVKDIKLSEIRIVIGIVLQMGIVKLPNRRMYWMSSTRNELIAESITRNRFDEILMVLHFNNNNATPGKESPLYNRCHKIQPLIDHFRSVFRKTVIPETKMSIDEQVIPFKGRHGLKRYLPKKPKKWGYKLWARAGGDSGYVYDFEVEGGLGSKGAPKNAVNVPHELGESEFVILRLSEELEELQHELFFDNLFSSPELMKYLSEQKKLWAVATLNQNRSRGCPILSEKEMKKKGRGFSQEVVDKSGKVVVIAWLDRRRILTISNYTGKDPIDVCLRYDKAAKETIEVDRPNSVAIYNAFMGGVDKSDMLLSLYRTKFRSRKWYLRIVFHLFSLSAINSWIIYRQLGGNDTLLKFQEGVISS